MPASGLLQMSGLDPQPRARGTRDGGEPGASRQSQPGVLSKGLASFLKTPRKHESFKTAGNVEQNAGVWAPLLDAHVFPAIVEKREEPHTLASRRLFSAASLHLPHLNLTHLMPSLLASGPLFAPQSPP